MLLFESYLAEDRNVHLREIPVPVFECPDAGYHRSIVGRITELRNVNRPAITPGMVTEGIAQTIVGRNAAGNGYMPDTRLLDGHAQFLHENIHDGMFQTGCDVFLVMLDEIGIVLYPFPHVVQERSLET